MKKIMIMGLVSLCGCSVANSNSQFGIQRIVSDNVLEANTVLTSDIDGDGDLDILSASSGDNKIAWYANDGNGNFGLEQIISTNMSQVVTLYGADLDGDGDTDVISASDSNGIIVWFENTNGLGDFGPQQIITSLVQITQSVYAADIDGDGDMDVLSTSTGNQSHKVSWYENTDGLGGFGGQRNLIPSNLRGAYSVQAGDMDGDDDLDIIYGTIDEIIWLRNTNGLGDFSSRILITTDIFGQKNIRLADIDNDGDLDVLFSSTWITGNRISIAWYKNIGNGNFVAQTPIDNSEIDGAWSIYPADLDGDGDLDVVSASLRDNTVVWYENLNGLGAFGSQKIISENASEATSVYAADIDGDGDNDVLSALSGDDKIAWYRNNSIVIDLIFVDSFE